MTETEKKKSLQIMKLKTNVFAVSLAAVAMAWMPQTMRAQGNALVLDNFQTGAGKIAATSGTQTGSGIVVGGRSVLGEAPSGPRWAGPAASRAARIGWCRRDCTR
jgi:hypothetical protein